MFRRTEYPRSTSAETNTLTGWLYQQLRSLLNNFQERETEITRKSFDTLPIGIRDFLCVLVNNANAIQHTGGNSSITLAIPEILAGFNQAAKSLHPLSREFMLAYCPNDERRVLWVTSTISPYLLLAKEVVEAEHSRKEVS